MQKEANHPCERFLRRREQVRKPGGLKPGSKDEIITAGWNRLSPFCSLLPPYCLS
jgi:hypothetical protein